MAEEAIDLWILDSGASSRAVVCARTSSDLAVATLPLQSKVRDLLAFRARLDASIRKRTLARPALEELTQFGHNLFDLCIRGDLARLYARLPAAPVRLRMFSNIPELEALPWEYLQEPNQPPGPRRERSIIRIVPTIGYQPVEPLPLGQRVHVLFVSSDPMDQEPVSWPELKATIERAFAARIPDRFELEAIEGTSRRSLVEAIQRRPCDVLHFSGHGRVVGGKGQLILTDRRTQKSSPITADELAIALRGKGIRLVVLSACETAAGDFADDFSVVAPTLVKAGISAVVANQLPVPDSTVATFVGALYASLLESGDIDMAMSEGRISLAIELASGPGAPLEWGIPTLYRHIATAQVFQP